MSSVLQEGGDSSVTDIGVRRELGNGTGVMEGPVHDRNRVVPPVFLGGIFLPICNTVN